MRQHVHGSQAAPYQAQTISSLHPHWLAGSLADSLAGWCEIALPRPAPVVAAPVVVAAAAAILVVAAAAPIYGTNPGLGYQCGGRTWSSYEY